MNTQQIVIIVVIVALVSVVLLVLLGLVLRTTLTRHMTRKLEVFNRVMLQEMDRHLDQFRHSLEEQRVLFNSMREKKTKTLVELYRRFAVISEAGQGISGCRDYKAARKCSRLVTQRTAQFFEFYAENGIIFTDEFSQFFKRWKVENRLNLQRLSADTAFEPSTDEEKTELLRSINGSWDAYTKALDELGAELKEEYTRMHTGVYQMLPKEQVAALTLDEE